MSPTTVPSMELVDLEDRKQLRGVFGAFPTGVTVVTVGGDSPRGMTASSFTSVSLAPPLVLVCVGKDAVMHGNLDRSQTFSVSVLDVGQEAVARHFADHSRPVGAGQFDAVGWQPGRKSGAPLIAGAVAHLECEKKVLYEGGDHTIFVGEVVSAVRWPFREALLFSGGRFRRFAPEHREGHVA
ncbi:NADH-dependent FAD reductase SgcE6 [Streptomyces griseus]|uniref:Oxidoreductase n=1 Tax=Streptomyces griseus subsp. griseus (strain JCM 4626 / CBS 651.72 / NBRC 13350 / KCC S-0626 / ISP 5235) TaxID=455632 RepID=B1VRM1_STRGG|nr:MULTISPECIES: flavin reductase family protein [Streptomyces]MYR11659.1 flavin reductase [Streptomyces sp. SID724]MYR48175.1 flavin reductase [Streptomyces sp. SID4928]MYT78970.1 flavin reductase [Streptomyces sp. SID8364]EGE40094.1 flavin reductase domain protein, FMN-binding [Streptomyces sp. ACT-1]MBW3703077.1 flavin reductase [Streptomyces griseus]